ncbi:hypothetical protein [Spirosoma radiotolerans]|uniref:Tetratricopeptide repeat protein n=1 Tax=Spirosoma radiotolerans TaxID=1379870 RepID=A0A0E3V8U0_9BACT|nr:hypothetical protein [Spirosoma radiotolerans]AKD56571.1 hypothetical protein SD10_18340 [Spirosoma radiotolerans]
MLALDKETFSYWVTHPDDLAPTDFVQLQESLETYPYCQTLHTLAAKAASVHQRSQAVPFVRQAAAHALSRNALRKLIENEFQWSENLLTKLNELSARHVPVPDDYQQESYALFKSKAGVSNGFPKLPLLRLPGQHDQSAEPIVTTPTPEDPTLIEINLQNDLVQIAETTPAQPTLSPADVERQRQLDLIDSFIKKEPRISPVRAKPGEPHTQEDLTKRTKPVGGSLVTESFAKILEKQGKLDKAREIYEKLIVKNPEKKAYFAAKISELTSADGGSTES